MEKVNYTVEELTCNPSFTKWVKGEASKEEARFWDRWVTQEESNFRVARHAEAELLGVAFQDTNLPPAEAEWQKMRARLRNNANPSPPSAGGGDSLRWFLRVAAILFVGVATGALAFVIYQPPTSNSSKMARQTVTTDYGEKKTVHFSDGSKVMLNANSGISYQPNSDPQKEMLIELDGEAYFSVIKRAPSSEGAFSVKTADGKISVLGTQFAVSTWEGQTQVVLEEGLVRMNPFGEGQQQQDEKKVLRPGQLAQFDRNGDTIRIKKVNPKVYTSWTTSTLVFDQTPLREVATRIEHTFGVAVMITDPQLCRQKISGSVENSELDVIISALSATTMIPIKMKGSRVYIGGLHSGKDS